MGKTTKPAPVVACGKQASRTLATRSAARVHIPMSLGCGRRKQMRREEILGHIYVR